MWLKEQASADEIAGMARDSVANSNAWIEERTRITRQRKGHANDWTVQGLCGVGAHWTNWPGGEANTQAAHW